MAWYHHVSSRVSVRHLSLALKIAGLLALALKLFEIYAGYRYAGMFGHPPKISSFDLFASGLDAVTWTISAFALGQSLDCLEDIRELRGLTTAATA